MMANFRNSRENGKLVTQQSNSLVTYCVTYSFDSANRITKGNQSYEKITSKEIRESQDYRLSRYAILSIGQSLFQECM
ncbi:hypothetical protein CEXT_788531 [Caerostris extrusa]|uniref:Uncharacterized protein n=1 Tax=Caerostris extrusa TaxID=172846 RepID=A0AAV4V306_CAEEX|nr:hypothetical protein CEXT_788531 [Caerostris extrusa]